MNSKFLIRTSKIFNPFIFRPFSTSSNSNSSLSTKLELRVLQMKEDQEERLKKLMAEEEDVF